MDYNKLLAELKNNGVNLDLRSKVKEALGQIWQEGWNKGYDKGREDGFTDGQNNMLETING